MGQQLAIISDISKRYGLDAETFEIVVRKSVMPAEHTREEFVQCCMVAHEHKLNPITKEIHFMRTKEGRIQPVVGVDGWIKKCNEHPQFDGMEFVDHFGEDKKLGAVTCRMYRKDRTRPTIVTEYFAECVRVNSKPGPWQSHPTRMLRHRALIQCARIAFGFAGIMDHDEFEQWQEERTAARDITPKREAIEIPDLTLGSAPQVSTAAAIPDLEITQDPPLADEDGFLDKLEEDRSLIDSEAELAELREANADMIARCSLAGQKRAAEILEAA